MSKSLKDAPPAGGKPNSFPVVTLTEAVTWLAWKRFIPKERLLKLYVQHRKKSSRRVALQHQLQTVARDLALLALDGKVSLRGYRQHRKDADLEECSQIPAAFIADGAFLEPGSDCAYPDTSMPAHWANGGYPCFRHIHLDVRELAPEVLQEAAASPTPVAPAAPEVIVTAPPTPVPPPAPVADAAVPEVAASVATAPLAFESESGGRKPKKTWLAEQRFQQLIADRNVNGVSARAQADELVKWQALEHRTTPLPAMETVRKAITPTWNGVSPDRYRPFNQAP